MTTTKMPKAEDFLGPDDPIGEQEWNDTLAELVHERVMENRRKVFRGALEDWAYQNGGR